ncbi:MAG TPA: hypothetical protein VFQ85_01180 [Mycobacteriales bacterium]|jgi:hypothetical protein|nr:hypothetical protein [Mycobacteriales bacterium]
MRLSQRALAAVAVAASVVAPMVLTAAPASASISAPCAHTTGEPKTIDIVIGSITLDRVPTGVDWSDCID